jgi:hypothetical protein
MHPYLTQLLMAERVAERQAFAAAWHKGEVRRRIPRRRPWLRPTWRIRTV